MRNPSLAFGLCTAVCLVSWLSPAYAELTFSAPPRESADKGSDEYQPIAAFLSKVIGQKVTYKHSDNWLTYQSEMQKDAYDIVFDGPHFVGWRMAKHGHTPLVKLPGNLSFVVVVRDNETRVQTVEELAGRTVCAHAPPNLATLTLQAQFSNPSRQPLVLETRGFKPAYDNVVSGKCVGTVMQKGLHAELDKDAKATRIIFTSKPVSNQAVSVSRRVTPDQRNKIVNGLMSAEGKAAAAALLARYKKDSFEIANSEEYDGLGVLLKDVWGFALQ